jgi:hypothetical protein
MSRGEQRKMQAAKNAAKHLLPEHRRWICSFAQTVKRQPERTDAEMSVPIDARVQHCHLPSAGTHLRSKRHKLANGKSAIERRMRRVDA